MGIRVFLVGIWRGMHDASIFFNSEYIPFAFNKKKNIENTADKGCSITGYNVQNRVL